MIWLHYIVTIYQDTFCDGEDSIFEIFRTKVEYGIIEKNKLFIWTLQLIY